MLIWLLLSACGGRTPETPTLEVEQALEEEQALVAMSAHWEDAGMAREAVYTGNLTELRAAGGRIADPDQWENVPEGHEEGVASVRAAATELSTASDITVASRALGQLAVRCGACHAATGAHVATSPLAEPTGDGVDALMAHHQRSSELLWRGMVRPSEEDITAGADEVLQRLPMTQEAIAERFPDSDLAQDLEATLVAQIAAVKATSGEARGQAYAELVFTCASCHLLSNDGPGIE